MESNAAELAGERRAWSDWRPDVSETTDPVALMAMIIGLHFVAPAVLTLIFSEFMRKKGWIKPGDMALA